MNRRLSQDGNVVIKGFVATMPAYTVSADVVTISNPSENDQGVIASSKVTLKKAEFGYLGRPTTMAEISWTDVAIPTKSDQLVLGRGFAKIFISPTSEPAISAQTSPTRHKD